MGQNSTKAGVVVWGQGDHGQLGLGSGPMAEGQRAFTPRLLERLTNVKLVVCGGHHTVAITEKEVYLRNVVISIQSMRTSTPESLARL